MPGPAARDLGETLNSLLTQNLFRASRRASAVRNSKVCPVPVCVQWACVCVVCIRIVCMFVCMCVYVHFSSDGSTCASVRRVDEPCALMYRKSLRCMRGRYSRVRCECGSSRPLSDPPPIGRILTSFGPCKFDLVDYLRRLEPATTDPPHAPPPQKNTHTRSRPHPYIHKHTLTHPRTLIHATGADGGGPGCGRGRGDGNHRRRATCKCHSSLSPTHTHILTS